MAGLAAGSVAAHPLLRGDSSGRPNVVLIVSDDHGRDALGCYGNRVIKTPNLNALAAEGVRFSHAFCTTASCSPSRSAILTGLHNHANGQYGLQHEFHHFQSFDHIKSLPVFLAKGGYRTARIGKFHVAPEAVYRFESVLSPGAANDMAAIGRSPARMADACKPFLTQGDSRPFFLYFCMNDPHRGLPFDTGKGPNLFGNRPQGYPGVKEITYRPDEVVVPPFLPDTPECRAELVQYYQSTSRMDQGVGRLSQVLKETGHYANTVIIYISDNGVAFPGAKTTLYDPGMCLPCIIRAPGLQQQGAVNPAMISWTGLTPTILDFAGIQPEEPAFHGRSFKGILDTLPPQGWDEVYASHTFHEVQMYYPMRVIRTRRYKLIWNLAYTQAFPLARDLVLSSTWRGVVERGQRLYGKRTVDSYLHRPEYELYDLQEDPDEIRNLVGRTSLRGLLAELKSKILAFQKRTVDPWTPDGSTGDDRVKRYWPQ